jgi:hypothetical protein
MRISRLLPAVKAACLYAGLILALLGASLSQAAAGTLIAGDEGTLISRGQDQLPPAPGTALQVGDVIKCLGRTSLKAFLGDALVLFGPLSETRIVSLSPLALHLEKGALRVLTEPGKAGAAVRVTTVASEVSLPTGDVFIRYNAASEFTEVLVIKGEATASNRKGVSSSIRLTALQNSLLSPDSPPSYPAQLQPREVQSFTRDTELARVPSPGDRYAELDLILKRMDRMYLETRRDIARPSLPANAPFRTLDAYRYSQSNTAFDQPGLSTSPGDASLRLDWQVLPPRLVP